MRCGGVLDEGGGAGARKGGSCVLLRIPVIHQTGGDVFCGITKRTMLSLPHLIIAPLPYPSGLDLLGDAAALADRRARRRRLGKQRSGGGEAKVCWVGEALQRDLCYANQRIPTAGLDWSRCAFSFFALPQRRRC